MKFTEQQPKDGDTVLHCEHLPEADNVHWFRVPGTKFISPSGETGEAEWIGICAECFLANPNPQKLEEFPVAGHSTWIGDDPAIEVNPLQPEQFRDGRPNVGEN